MRQLVKNSFFLFVLVSSVSFARADDSSPVGKDQPSVNQSTPVGHSHGIYFGGELGPVFLRGGDTDTQILLMGDFGFDLAQSNDGTTLSVGIMGGVSPKAHQFNHYDNTSSAYLVIVGPEAYARHLFGTPFYLGGRLGLAVQSATLIDQNNTLQRESGSSMFFSPVIGGDIRISSKIFINVEASYFWVNQSHADSGTGYSYPSNSGLFTGAGVRVEI